MLLSPTSDCPYIYFTPPSHQLQSGEHQLYSGEHQHQVGPKLPFWTCVCKKKGAINITSTSNSFTCCLLYLLQLSYPLKSWASDPLFLPFHRFFFTFASFLYDDRH